MPALKDIGRMSSLPGVSPLAQSPLWNKEVAQIHPMQVEAFIKRLALQGLKDSAETAVALCCGEIALRVAAGEFPRPAMLDYSVPDRVVMTAGELRDGLEYLGREKGAAILFALETRLSGHDVGRLTWNEAMRMFQTKALSPLAIRCSQVCPRQLYLAYVFWKNDPDLDLATPFFSLEADVFDAFGLLWPELAQAYERLIMIDPKADAEEFKRLLGIDRGDGS